MIIQIDDQIFSSERQLVVGIRLAAIALLIQAIDDFEEIAWLSSMWFGGYFSVHITL
jgi:hypothetical protein